MLRTVTKSIELPIPSAQAQPYLADVSHWPAFCAYTVTSARLIGPDTYKITCFDGEGKLLMRAQAPFGLLDHEIHDSSGNLWSVASRVTDTFMGSVWVKTFCQPRAMPDSAFDLVMRHTDEEMQTLRRVIPRTLAAQCAAHQGG